MLKILYVVLGFMLLGAVVSCHSSSNSTKSASFVAAPADTLMDPVSKLVLRRRGCFGNCPVYTVTLLNDSARIGIIQRGGDWHGDIDTTIHLDPGQLRSLIVLSDSIGFRAMDGAYLQDQTFDLYTSEITIVRNGKGKTVVYNGSSDMAKTLESFAKAIDDITGAKRFVTERR